MKISGRELIGLTDSELLKEMLVGNCPDCLDSRLDTHPCNNSINSAGDCILFYYDCLDCWSCSLSKIYEVESEE